MKTYLRPRDSGFTIIELMVSLTIGLVVTWAVCSLFTATSRTFSAQDSASRSQESGRYALTILSQHVRQAGFFELTGMEQATSFAGFVAEQTPTLYSVPAIKGCDGKTMVYGNGWNCSGTATPSTTLASGSAAPDAILVAYQVQSMSAAITAGVNSLLSPVSMNPSVGTDCLGQDPNAGTAYIQGVVAINYFYVDTVNHRLMCLGNGDQTARSLVEGVEDLQIYYGINQDPLTATSTLQYVAASSVADWTKVQAVRLCVQIRSVQVTGGGAKSTGADYSTVTKGTDCQGRNWSQSGLYKDGVLRRAYWSTITLRNQSPRIPL